ncbi:hypothetical protein HF563_12895, partial [Acidithiobacillus ferridurans]|nr:hypothetical protein [Acidithiobacillus ferridurans]
LLVNAGVGFWQEHKAGNAIAMLKQKLALRARVLRDGLWQEIAAQDLVPGDIILLKKKRRRKRGTLSEGNTNAWPPPALLFEIRTR